MLTGRAANLDNSKVIAVFYSYSPICSDLATSKAPIEKKQSMLFPPSGNEHMF